MGYRAEAYAIAKRTEDAFSYGLYYSTTSWRRIAEWLLQLGYAPAVVEEILRSKHMRWASDSTAKNPMKMTLEKFQAYFNQHDNRKEVDRMLTDMFGGAP